MIKPINWWRMPRQSNWWKLPLTTQSVSILGLNFAKTTSFSSLYLQHTHNYLLCTPPSDITHIYLQHTHRFFFLHTPNILTDESIKITISRCRALCASNPCWWSWLSHIDHWSLMINDHDQNQFPGVWHSVHPILVEPVERREKHL